MASITHTPGPWMLNRRGDEIMAARGPSVGLTLAIVTQFVPEHQAQSKANACLMMAAPELLEALHEGRRAIGDHFAPNDCYATGPLTGDPIRDLVQCPACSFIAMHDAAIAKATGAA